MSPPPTLKVTIKVPGKTTPVDLGSLPLSTSSSQLLQLLEAKANVVYRTIDLFSREREKRVVVVDGEDSCVVRTGLRINIDTSLSQFYNDYLRSINDVHANTPFPVIISNESIQMGPLNIIPKRTLRVPTDNKKHALPPGLGSFPLLPVSSYRGEVPDGMGKKGGAFMPMYQNEALWLYFQHRYPGAKYALKVSVGNVNAITGRLKHSKTLPGTQDYVSTQQPWLDGICTEPEVVRQFVAVPLGSKHSIEHQVTGKDKTGGIQFDIFPLLKNDGRFRLKDGGPSLVGDELLATPRESGLAVGAAISMMTRVSGVTANKPLSALAQYAIDGHLQLAARDVLTIPVNVLSAGGKLLEIEARPSSPVNVLCAEIERLSRIPRTQQRLSYFETILDPNSLLSDYSIPAQATIKLGLVLKGGFCLPSSPLESRMSMAAGGQIRQKIYADETDPRKYDRTGTRVHLHVVNSVDYQKITGKKAPSSPVKEKTYRKSGLPYFELYDETVPATNRLSNRTLSSVQPVPGDSEHDATPSKVIGIQFRDLEDIDWVSPPAY
ncbi:hypothetical protein BDY24DRAFT_382211 [Mrakia frigida]|uniref:ubiquitin-like domain-containing protein n=1 Tax=Mrakia frigida TaxID=29902 RepID=UPI003FCC1C41